MQPLGTSRDIGLAGFASRSVTPSWGQVVWGMTLDPKCSLSTWLAQ